MLKVYGLFINRIDAQDLAAKNPNATEIDFSKASAVTATAMHELICLFPDAAVTGLEGVNKQEYDWVVTAIETISVPKLSLLKHAAEDGGLETPGHSRDTRRNNGFILQGLGLVTVEEFERDGLPRCRFTATKIGLKVLKKRAGR